MDDSGNRLNFDLGKKKKIHHKLFSANQQHGTLLPVTSCAHKLKAEIAFCVAAQDHDTRATFLLRCRRKEQTL